MNSLSLACLEDRLQAHPVLRKRFEALLATVEAEGGTLERADDMELRVIEELRRLGHELLQDWAAGKVMQCTAAVRQTATAVQGHGQKNSTGIPPSG
jgi:hypothetical protein